MIGRVQTRKLGHGGGWVNAKGGNGMMRAASLGRDGSDRPFTRGVVFERHGNLQKFVHNARGGSRPDVARSTDAIGRYSRT